MLSAPSADRPKPEFEETARQASVGFPLFQAKRRQLLQIGQFAVMPPSIISSVPVIQDASSDAK